MVSNPSTLARLGLVPLLLMVMLLSLQARPILAQESSTSAANFVINHEKFDTIESASTYSNGSFRIYNASPTQKVQDVKIDLGSSLLPDMVFDPKGKAGDSRGLCFKPHQNAEAVGLESPSDPCVSPFSGGTEGEGYKFMELSFADFGPGESFTFSVDVDPTSIKGATTSGGAGSVSGLELTGTKATLGFDDGSTQTAQTFRVPNSQTGSKDLAKTPAPNQQLSIEVAGVTAPAKVQQAQQTVRVAGPAGSGVSLMVLEGGMFTEPPGGFHDQDPFEANSAVKVTEYPAKIGPGGTADIPVALTKSNAAAGLNYMVAAVRGGEASSPLSNVAVLEYDPPTNRAPVLQSIADKSAIEGKVFSLQLQASDADNDPITYSAQGLPNGLTIDQTSGKISGKPAPGSAAGGPYSVKATASDGADTDSESFELAVGKPADTAKPTISGLKPSGKTRDRTPAISATVRDSASELGKGDIRLYVDGRARAFSYSPSTDRLSGVSKRLSYGGHTVKVVATDDAGNTASGTSRFKVVKRRG